MIDRATLLKRQTKGLSTSGMLQVAALVGCAAAGTLAVTLIWHLPTAALFVSMGLLGAYRGSNNPPLESLWADSVPRGARCQFAICKPRDVAHLWGCYNGGPLFASGHFAWLMCHESSTMLLLCMLLC